MAKKRRISILPPEPPQHAVRIVLHGALRKQFGTHVDWGCPTPANAIYALCVNKKGFREALEKGAYRIVRGPMNSGMDMEAVMLGIRFSDRVREMHIVPVARGRAKGNGGAFVKIILGVVLIAAAVLTAGGAIGVAAVGSAATGVAGSGGAITGALGLTLGNTLFGVSAASIGLMGISLLATGVGDILSHQPKPPAPNASFLLSGPTNTTQQGGPVPLAYGFKVRVGSTVIASSYEAVALKAGVELGQGTGQKGGSK